MHKVLLHLVAKTGAKAELIEQLLNTASKQALGEQQSISVLRALEDDNFRASGDARPLPYAFDASVEWQSIAPLERDSMKLRLVELLSQCQRLIHTDLSAVLGGSDRVFTACDPTPIRFQYCMRRRADHSHEQYIDYYEREHSKFGIGTHGIEGYTQFHVDPIESLHLRSAAAVGLWQYDSVSELHIADMDTFFSGIAKGIDAGNPGEDEDRFVDRRRSTMWISDTIERFE